MKKSRTALVAQCGVLGAAAFTVMLIGTILPFATVIAPALAGLFVFFAGRVAGNKAAVYIYIVVGALSLVLLPDKEIALLFVQLLGYYPLLKNRVERMKNKAVVFTVKLLIFNAALALFIAEMFLFTYAATMAELARYGVLLGAAFILLANVTFIVYDIAIVKLDYFFKRHFNRLMRF